MKEHILQILRMKDEGKLTAEQAAELLAALADEGKAAEAGPAEPAAGKVRSEEGWREFARDMGAIGQQVTQAIGGAVRQKDKSGNMATLSHVAAPEGVDFEFHDNSINVSQIVALRLNRGRVVNNLINASRVSDLTVSDGAMGNCKINGSSLDEVAIEGGTLGDSSFHGSKCVRLRLEAGCQWIGTECSAMNIKDVALRSAGGGAKVLRNTFRGASVAGIEVGNGSTLEDGTFAGISMSDSRFDAAVWKDVAVRAMKITGMTVLRSSFVDVRLEGKISRQSTIENTRFEDCKWKDCRLVGCSFTDCVIVGVEVEGIRAEGVELSGVTIKGADELKKALRIA